MAGTLTPYELFQLRRYGNIIPENCEETFENGIEELNRLSEWMDSMAENQLTELISL